MRALLPKLWPLFLAGGIVAVLAIVTLLARRAERDGWAQRARVSLLAMLVGVLAGPVGACDTTSGATAGATGDTEGDDGPVMSECYVAPPPDAELDADADTTADPAPPDMITVECYAAPYYPPDVDAITKPKPDVPTDNVTVDCYVAPSPDIDVPPVPETVDASDADDGWPEVTCYAPYYDAWYTDEGPLPDAAEPVADAGPDAEAEPTADADANAEPAPDLGEEEIIMCYDPIPPDGGW